MKPKLRKYISIIVLIVLCLICATVFYVSASELWQESSDGTDTNTNTSSDTSADSDLNSESDTEGETDSETDTQISLPQEAVIDMQGTIMSEYLCPTNLRCEWAALKNDGEGCIYLSVELYLDTRDTVTSLLGGKLIVNGEEKEFEPSTAVGTSTLLTTYTSVIETEDEAEFDVSALLNINIIENSGLALTQLSLNGSVSISEKYENAEKSHLIELEHISQYPDLPSGDEITSLAMVLSYLGYDVDKCDLCDLYLEKGPVGYTDFNKANVGNPRNAYNSYGCLPPVIIDSAMKYISVNGGKHEAYNYSQKNVDSLYYEVSQGNPVIVWACENFDITPSISRIWVIDGKNLYLKSNMACMVLIGYDYEKNIVTLANPAGNVFEIDMDLFEERYLEMGSYSVVVK